MKIAILTKETTKGSKFESALDAVVAKIRKHGHYVFVFDNYGPIYQLSNFLSSFDLAIAFYCPRILKKSEYTAPKYGIINVHIGYLPLGRGAMPNVWSIVDNFKAGVAVHIMAERVDEGDVIARRDVYKMPTDTGETLYNRLLEASAELLTDIWTSLEMQIVNSGGLFGIKQDKAEVYRTYRQKDVNEIDDLEKVFGEDIAHQFVNILRARTFTGHEAAYIRDDRGRKVYVRVSLSHE